jgi:hypothetical protein
MDNSIGDSFSGFMPMIDQINITPEATMLNTEGALIKAHSICVTARDGNNFVFSISQTDLMRLYFLIPKVINA